MVFAKNIIEVNDEDISDCWFWDFLIYCSTHNSHPTIYHLQTPQT